MKMKMRMKLMFTTVAALTVVTTMAFCIASVITVTVEGHNQIELDEGVENYSTDFYNDNRSYCPFLA